MTTATLDPQVPEDTQPPRQPKPKHSLRFRTTRAGLIIVSALAVIGGIGAAAGSHNTAATSPAASASAPATSAPVTFSPAPVPAASTPAPLTGPVGTTFTVTSTNDTTNAATEYSVIAAKVLDPAYGSDEFSTPDAGSRFVGVEFTISGVTGYSSDDANTDAVVIGSDGQTYQPDFDSISAGTNFDSGDFSVSDGQTATGWVTFQLPDGVTVASVQWQADMFGSNPPATWTNS